MTERRRSLNTLTAAASFFNGERLTMARQLAGLKKSHLASLIEMSPASVTAWESGTKQPNRATVAKLALALHVEPQFFGGGAPQRINKPHFRSLRSTPQIARDGAYAFGQSVAEIADMLENAVEFPTVSLPDIPIDSESSLLTPEEAAREARKFFDISPGPIQHVVRQVERSGVVVVFSEPGMAAIDAYSFHSTARPVIVLNPVKDDYYRQRFDVAHELGHLIMHHDPEPGGKIAEAQANRFASEFLMPAAEISKYLPSSTAGKAWAQLADLKEYWGVSLAALLFRARSLDIMSDVSYRNAMIRMSQNGWRRAEPGRISTVEMPSMLPRAKELLSDSGIDATTFLSGSGFPVNLFDVAASRIPRANSSEF